MDNLIIFVFQIMTLPLEGEANFQDFYEQKEKKRDMTEAAFQKRKMQTRKTIANMMAKGAYGMYVDEMVEQIKEKDQKLHRLILNLYLKDGKNAETIAEFIEMPLDAIKAIIATFNAEKK